VDLQLAGKVALITGAGGGIGRETARLLAREGARIAAADVRLETAEETLQVVRAAGSDGAAFALDVTSAESVERAVAGVETQVGLIDVLVNCAGIYRVGDYSAVDPDAWRQVLDVNLTGTYLTCRAVLPRMIGRGRGSIVNLSSISGRTKSTLAAPSYVASKAGVIGLTMSLASQSAAHGVRVNAVAPGPADTDMIRGLPDDLQARLIPTIPMGRLGTAHEIASAIVFLASDAASFITGETLNVNGGGFMV
jgi:NAD(P)-dependent dehydrogenase (short-subunit alcohol dehydrogenase family)